MFVDFFEEQEDTRFGFFVVERESTVLINLSGYFTVSNKQEINSVFEEIKAGYYKKNIVFSFMMVKDIDTYGISYVHYINDYINSVGKEFSVIGVNEDIYRNLKLSDLKNEITIK